MTAISRESLPYRNHLTAQPLIQLCNCAQDPYVNGKPSGFWYGIKDSWIDWMASYFEKTTEDETMVHVDENAMIYDIQFMPNVCTTIREPITKEKKVLILPTVQECNMFFQKYGTDQIEFFHTSIQYRYVNWISVAEDYAGIEIPNFDKFQYCHFDHRQRFMCNWDVPSGCVWDVSVIESFNLFYPEEIQ